MPNLEDRSDAFDGSTRAPRREMLQSACAPLAISNIVQPREPRLERLIDRLPKNLRATVR